MIPPRFELAGRQWHSFRVCGVTGLALGTGLAVSLARATALSPALVVVLLVTGVITFLSLTMATKIVTGREALVYYHHEIAVLTISAALLSALGRPVVPYLDVTALGLGVFLTFGRVGCLIVGCCHGRPGRWGVRYTEAHAAEGFLPCYVGARLFPVQALEAVIVAGLVATGALLMLAGRPPGAALATYVVGYSTARIWIEELRGDRVRPYWLRLSEAQWTSLVLIASVVVGEWQGRLPWMSPHAAAGVIAVLSLIVLASSRTPAGAIVHARHASEIAEIIQASEIPGVGQPVVVRRTSQTLGLSTQSLGRPGEPQTLVYSLSRSDRQLTLPEASAVAGLISHLRSHTSWTRRIIAGGSHVFHVILQERDR
jgi:hypothetical protein